MELVKFVLPPDNSSYSATDGKEVVATQLNGGASRYRRDILGATSTVDCVWILGQDEFKYLRSFYRAISESGSTPFLIDLILDDFELTEHKAYFVPGSMKLTGQKGLTYWASAQLEVYPAEISPYAADYVYLYNEFGKNWARSEDLLNTIVNQLWPEVL